MTYNLGMRWGEAVAAARDAQGEPIRIRRMAYAAAVARPAWPLDGVSPQAFDDTTFAMHSPHRRAAPNTSDCVESLACGAASGRSLSSARGDGAHVLHARFASAQQHFFFEREARIVGARGNFALLFLSTVHLQ
jgi:hypothetical protein